SRKLCDHCPRCSEKNHLRARFCNACGCRLDENRFMRHGGGNHAGSSRLKLHADIAHPINADCRSHIEQDVVDAYQQELERSKQPGYVAPSLDHEDMDYFDDRPLRLRPTGTSHELASMEVKMELSKPGECNPRAFCCAKRMVDICEGGTYVR